MTISKNRKARQRILNSLKDRAKLSTNRGDFVSTKTPLSKKVRRHSGRYTPIIVGKGKVSELVANAEEPQEEYDDWLEYRDGFRGDLDMKKLRKKKGSFWQDPDEIKEINEKIKKQIKIRKAKKQKGRKI